MSRIVSSDIGRFLALQATASLLVLAIVSLPVSSIEARPELCYGNTVWGLDFVDSGISQTVFHQESLASADDEAMALSFPASAGPALAQTRDATVAATSTGFFTSNYQFCPGINYGAPFVGHGQFMAPSPVTAARFTSRSLLYPEMIVEGNLLSKNDLDTGKGIKITLPPVQSGIAYSLVDNLSRQQAKQGATSPGAANPVILSGQTFDFNAKPDAINNTSIVERLWRNVKQGSKINDLYEGSADLPRWIAPAKNPYSLIDCGDSFQANKDALNATQPGKYLTRSYWTL